MTIIEIADAMGSLEGTVAAVKDRERHDSKIARGLDALTDLACKEGIPLAIVGGLAAIHHGYERFTKDIDAVARSAKLDVLIRVAPQYGIKVIWHHPEGWHKLQYDGVAIDVVPEGRKPRKDAPAGIPGPAKLGVRQGAGFAAVAGWIETKLGSFRVQDQADVVQVIKVTSATAMKRIRKQLGKAHELYQQRFDDLHEIARKDARKEKEQERERGAR